MNWFTEYEGNILDRFDLYLNGNTAMMFSMPSVFSMSDTPMIGSMSGQILESLILFVRLFRK